MQYTNNSVVNITDIGTGSAALICTTTLPGCCLSTDGSHWYFPNGSQVQRTGTTYYRTRTDSHISPPGTVRLHRISGATTTGVFHCDILDTSGYLQSIYVGIYTATTGESCTLKRNTFVQQVLMVTRISDNHSEIHRGEHVQNMKQQPFYGSILRLKWLLNLILKLHLLLKAVQSLIYRLKNTFHATWLMWLALLFILTCCGNFQLVATHILGKMNIEKPQSCKNL